MKIEYLARSEFKKRFGPHIAGEHYTTEEGEHVVVLPRGASTKTKMHEIAHVELGHVGPAKTYSEKTQRELAADSWVYEKLGTEPTWAEILGDFVSSIEELIEMGYSVSSIFTWLKNELEDAGYAVERDDRSRLWWLIRDKYDKLRGRRG